MILIQVCGKLGIEMSRSSGSLAGYRIADAGTASADGENQSETSSERGSSVEVTETATTVSDPDSSSHGTSLTHHNTITCKV